MLGTVKYSFLKSGIQGGHFCIPHLMHKGKKSSGKLKKNVLKCP